MKAASARTTIGKWCSCATMAEFCLCCSWLTIAEYFICFSWVTIASKLQRRNKANDGQQRPAEGLRLQQLRVKGRGFTVFKCRI